MLHGQESFNRHIKKFYLINYLVDTQFCKCKALQKRKHTKFLGASSTTSAG